MRIYEFMAIGAASVLTSGRALALSQAECDSGYFGLQVGVNIGATEYDGQPASPAGSSPDGIYYNKNVASPWYPIYVNSNVDQLRPYFGHFNTSSGDVLFMYTNVLYDYYGALNMGYSSSLGSDTFTIPSSRILYWSWSSDWNANSDTAPSITAFEVKCKATQTSTPAAAPTIAVNQRVEGLLIGTGDILYFDVVQPANKPLLLVMDGLTGTTPPDIDLYASATVAQPDYTATWVSVDSTAHEAIDVPAVTTSRTIHIGVYAYSAGGGGHFALHALVQNIRPSITAMTYGIPALSATDKSQITKSMRAGAVGELAASNGNVFLKHVSVVDTPSSGACDQYHYTMCLTAAGHSSEGTTQYSPEGFGFYHISADIWNSITDGSRQSLVHEMGHGAMGLYDEYDSLTNYSCASIPIAPNPAAKVCGHSVMAQNANAAYSNFYCSISHCSDGQVASEYPGCPSGSGGTTDPCGNYRGCCNEHSDSNWALMEAAGKVPYGPHFAALLQTPDPTHYFSNPTLQNMVAVTFP